jgi:NADH:ubiquinone oxidoreductase subunit F (NADH-binding)
VGSHKAHEMLTKALSTEDGPADLKDRLAELEATVRLTSICGLGQVALGPVLSVLGMERGGTEARPHPRP